jgi:hypothetical protein
MSILSELDSNKIIKDSNNKNILEFMNGVYKATPDVYSSKIYYEPILESSIQNIKYDETGQIDSILINMNSESKPPITMINHELYYKSTNGYEKFDSDFYDNIKVNVYDLSYSNSDEDLFFDMNKEYSLVIEAQDPEKPMILADKVLYPLRNYMINDISADGAYLDLSAVGNKINLFFND